MAGIPGEEADGVMTAVDFLRKVGEQEAYPVQGRAVVIGGGQCGYRRGAHCWALRGGERIHVLPGATRCHARLSGRNF